ncbi:MAG: Crp/Fnr family transcriptional regulator [Candidatus Binatia bacterium]
MQTAPDQILNAIDARALKQLKTLASFSLPQLKKLAGNLSIRHLKKNQIIFDQDEEAKLVYLLISGVVRCSHLNSDQKQIIVSLISPGEFFGFDAFAPRTRHPFRCDAFEASVVGAIKPATLTEALMGVSGGVFFPWYGATMHSGRMMYVHCIKGMGLDVRKRLALELMNLAERFGIADARGVVILLRISHEVLAGLVGASRQQVTEHLNELDRDKAIARDGRRIIVNINKLRNIVEGAPGSAALRP